MSTPENERRLRFTILLLLAALERAEDGWAEEIPERQGGEEAFRCARDMVVGRDDPRDVMSFVADLVGQEARQATYDRVVVENLIRGVA